MDFDSAIHAHASWKSKLACYIAKPDHSLNAATLSADNQCELGRWLQGEGRKYAALPEFKQLVVDHAHFHKAAGEVVRKADSGERVGDEIALGAKSEYALASGSVVATLMKMKAKVKSAA
jgi:hypothetical protein